MVSNTFTTSAEQIVNGRMRPTRVAIVHGSSITGATVSNDEIHDALIALFSPLNIQVFSVLELSKAGMIDLISSQTYDIIGLVGEVGEFSSLRKRSASEFRLHGDHEDSSNDTESIVLSFTPRTRFKDVRKYFRFF